MAVPPTSIDAAHIAGTPGLAAFVSTWCTALQTSCLAILWVPTAHPALHGWGENKARRMSLGGNGALINIGVARVHDRNREAI